MKRQWRRRHQWTSVLAPCGSCLTPSRGPRPRSFCYCSYMGRFYYTVHIQQIEWLNWVKEEMNNSEVESDDNIMLLVLCFSTLWVFIRWAGFLEGNVLQDEEEPIFVKWIAQMAHSPMFLLTCLIACANLKDYWLHSRTHSTSQAWAQCSGLTLAFQNYFLRQSSCRKD